MQIVLSEISTNPITNENVEYWMLRDPTITFSFRIFRKSKIIQLMFFPDQHDKNNIKKSIKFIVDLKDYLNINGYKIDKTLRSCEVFKEIYGTDII